MTVTLKLYTKWKATKGFDSDRSALRALGLSHSAAVPWKAGKNGSAATIERMARDLGETDQAICELLFQSMAQASHADAESRRVLERMAKRMAALVLVTFAVLALPMEAAKAAGASASSTTGLFIMRTQCYARMAATKFSASAVGITKDVSFWPVMM